MKRLLVAALLLLLAAPARAESYPAADGYVFDERGFLGQGVEVRLERLLADYDRRTTNQVGVALLGSLDGASPEDYGFGLFNAWGVGTAERDNGVLLLLAVDDRASRIQVGLGVEELLTDAEAQTILDDVLAPAARAGNLDAAVLRSVTAIRAQLGGTRAPAPAAATGTFHGGAPLPVYADDVVEPGPVEDPFLVDGPTTTFPQDSGFPGGGSVLALGVLGMAVSVVVALFRGAAGLPNGGTGWRRSHDDDDRWSGSSSFGGSGHSGGSSGGGSHGSSGGGFGGGSSGGGGASGSW